METTWILIGIAIICLIILIIYIIKRNAKDEKEVEKYFNETGMPEHKHEHDTDDEI